MTVSIWDYTKRYNITADYPQGLINIIEAGNGEWVRVEDVHEIRERGWKDGWQHGKDLQKYAEQFIKTFDDAKNEERFQEDDTWNAYQIFKDIIKKGMS